MGIGGGGQSVYGGHHFNVEINYNEDLVFWNDVDLVALISAAWPGPLDSAGTHLYAVHFAIFGGASFVFN